MKQRYNELTENLCWRAVDACFDHKWTRADILAYVEEYAGISRREIYAGELNSDKNAKNEATDCIAFRLMDMVEDIAVGKEPESVEPPTVKPRPDGMTGKIRNIACLCIDHQLLGHVAVLGLKPLFKAIILPQQHASIPKRGQTKLAKQTARYLRKDSLGIRFAQKTDAVNAYGSLMYAKVIKLIERRIPSAHWILAVLRYLEKLAPGGHLIIGGYIDAWLFNYAMAEALRFVLTTGHERRGKFIPYVVRVEDYMDDVCLMARTRSGLEKAVKKLSAWMQRNLGMIIKTTTGVIRILSTAEEKRRKKLPKLSQRGCPCIDMGGFRICRTHMTMRARIVKRVIRTFTRAWREIQATGTMRRARAQAIIARNGFIKQTCSDEFKTKYNVEQIVAMAKKITGYWSRVQSRKRKEWLEYVVSQDPIEQYTKLRSDRKPSGWPALSAAC